MSHTCRLVSYNILEGLQPLSPAGRERRLLDRGRCEAALRVVAALDPDVLVLNEALFCQQVEGRAVDYGALFGFPFQACALYDGTWGNAILSKARITSSRQMRIYNRGGLVATLQTHAGPLTVASYHPHPGRLPEHKVEDFTRLVQHLQGPVVVCGDMNCVHPDDALDRGQLVEGFRRFSSDPEAVVDHFLRSGELVFQALAELGFRDAIPVEGRRHTIPTDLLSKDKLSAIRIDHVLCNDRIEVVDGAVIHSPDTERASDHHPVLLDFRLRADPAAT